MFARISIARRTARTVAARFHTAVVNAEASQFTMPALSPTMTEGGIARWEKKEGESFSAGDLLVQIETDKAQMDVEAQDDGVLVKILVPEGTQGVSVNSPIAIIAEDGDDIGSIDIAGLSAKKAAPASADSAPKAAPAPAPTPAPVATPAAKPAAAVAAAVQSHGAEDNSAQGKLAPAAAFAIHANHISNASEIQGSGPKGRILKGDVLQFLKEGKAVINKDQSASTAASAKATPVSTPAKKPAAAGSNDAETAFLVQSLEPSVLRYLAELELAKKSTTVQVPAEKLVKLIKSNKALTDSAFALRAAALALHQVSLSKDGNTRVGIAVEGSRAPSVIEITDASTASVLDLAAAIKEAKKTGKAAAELPAVVLAPEGLYTPETLPKATTVIVVGKPHDVVSSSDASAALDNALSELIGGAVRALPAKKTSSAIDVSVISESPAAAAYASKIKAFLSNPELLTF
ncbi:pyridoxine biosynthesis protein [Kickxella alabastrina]|uniref:Pyridoxine biosynthesis protein n=1 Tax=Kickxella alabastrina TaxID=61397 RepID=A0ACC1IGK4_9FUNG|nr:pyridoxine biosynthesis protein [Kickxella alabastrina]